MARYFRRKTNKKVYRKRRVYRKRKTTVASLSKKVNYLSRKVAGNTNTIFMYSERANSQPLSANYTYYNLLPLSSAAPCFGDQGTDFEPSNKIILKKLKLDMTINASNETDFITGTAFVVSFKSQGMTSTFYDPITGLLTLSNGLHYTQIAGTTRLNPRYFNILWYKRWNTGNGGAAWNTTGVGDARQYMRRYAKTLNLNYSVISPAGNWRALNSPIKGEENRFLLIFSDDSTLDAEYVRGSVMVNITAISPN